MKRSITLLSALLFCVLASGQDYKPVGNNIKTRWAAEVGPDNARPEYPRPQMVRPDWVNLNGLWNYAVSSAETLEMPKAEGKILVPFCIESSLSGVGRRVDENEALWYSREISLPEKWSGKTVLLHFDAVDYKADVFVNGELIGSHAGGYTAFSFDVTECLAKGPAQLVVRVWDPINNPDYSIPHGKQKKDPSGIYYTPVTGIWQTVWLEAVGSKSYIEDYNVSTDISTGIVSVNTSVAGALPTDEVRVDVLRPRKGYNPEKPGCPLFKKGKKVVKAGETASVKVRRPKLWSPDTPYLYGLRISLLRDGKVIDRVNGYTALRKISEMADENGVKRLALNDEILFQVGPLDQGWWPDGLYTAPTQEAMLFDVVKTKELGFNMIRKHVKVEPSRWYYDCDREGILVWQDMPSIGRYPERVQWAQGNDMYGTGEDYAYITPEKAENFYREWTDVVSQLKKFQSIVVWVPFNEAWGQFDTKAVVDYTKSMDPDRLVNAASGGNWVKGAGEILDSHHYPQPTMRILDADMVNVLGEYGGIGRPIDGHVWDIGRKWGYVQFDSEEKVTETFVTYQEDLIDLKQLDMCAAAVYTQTTDVEGEVNGLFTYDREILKINADKVREANLKLIAAPCTPAQPALIPASRFHYGLAQTKGMQEPYLNLFTLRAGDIAMQVTDFGARVISLFVPDKNGDLDDVVVGYDDAERFVHNTGERFLGATVGRVANRIGGASFTLDGKKYDLPANNNGQTLHGGLIGVDMVRWKLVSRTQSSITLEYTAPDGQDGFPGKLKIVLTYTLTPDNALDIKYEATTNKATPVNLSNHAFYNLKGSKGGTILDHELTILSDAITPVDKFLIPTGELMSVEGTPFDFRKPHVIGERVNENHPQLVFGGGYDHNWALNVPSDGELHKVCELYEPSTGRAMEVLTDQPGLQFYCGNFFDGSYSGKNGKIIGYREALALETQKFPDAVHHENFQDIILRPGEKYTQHTVYKFSTR